MSTFENRLTRVEERIDSMSKLINESVIERRRQTDRTNEILEEIQEKINRIQEQTDKMQGFGKGVAYVFSGVGALAAILWDKLKGD